MLVFFAYLMVASWQCIITLNERYTAILRIPNSFYYVACFLGFGDGIIRIIQQFYFAFKGKNDDDIKAAFCRVQRTPMRFRADAVQSTTDALKQCIFSYSRGFITTV